MKNSAILSQSKFNKFSDMLLTDLNPQRLENEVASGQIDWAFTYLPSPFPGIEHLSLSKFFVNVYGTNEYIKNLQLGNRPTFVLPSDDSPMNPTGDKNLKNWERQTNNLVRGVTVNKLSTGIAFSLQSKTAIFLPDFLVKIHNLKARSDNQLHEMKGHGLLEESRTLYLIKRKGNIEKKEIKEICSLIRKMML